jgi:hypothetical protein
MLTVDAAASGMTLDAIPCTDSDLATSAASDTGLVTSVKRLTQISTASASASDTTSDTTCAATSAETHCSSALSLALEHSDILKPSKTARLQEDGAGGEVGWLIDLSAGARVGEPWFMPRLLLLLPEKGLLRGSGERLMLKSIDFCALRGGDSAAPGDMSMRKSISAAQRRRCRESCDKAEG